MRGGHFGTGRPSADMRPRPAGWRVITRRSIARRFLSGAAVVLGVAVVTIFVVDALVSPAILHAHLMQADLTNPETVLRHVEEGARSSNLLALMVAIVIAVVAALLVSVYLATRVAASVAPLAAAARDVASGNYATHVDAGVLGAEFDELTEAFNGMSQRLASIEQSRSRLFSDLAHEMRTPLAVVQAQLEGIEDGVVGVDESIPVLQAQVERLTRLSTDIGLLSRAQEHALNYEFAPVEPATVVRASVDAMALRFGEAGVQLDLDVESHASAALDAARFGQVITNLLANALNATGRGGHVHVGVTRRATDASGPSASHPGAHPSGSATPRASTVDACNRPGPGVIVVQVSDDGVGMAADEVAHVFDRFTRLGTSTDRSRGGFGIGLTVARQIVTAHHGRISAESPGAGLGAVFTVTVPALERG